MLLGALESRGTWGLQLPGEHPSPKGAECWGALSCFEMGGAFSWPRCKVMSGKGKAGVTPVLGTLVSPWTCPWVVAALGYRMFWWLRLR